MGKASRDRWHQQHKTISVHVTIDEYHRVLAVLERKGQSFAELFREALGLQEQTTAEAYEQGRWAGSEQGRKKGYEEGRAAGQEASAAYRLTFPCVHCRQPIEIRSGDNEVAKTAVQAVVNRGFGHSECIQRLKVARGQYRA